MSTLLRLRLIRIACLAGIALVVGGSGALAAEIASQPRDATPRIEARASGKVVVTNSRKGKAVLSASGLKPGAQVSGTVKIGNKGRKVVTLRLTRAAMKQVAGPYGGQLGPLLRLSVIDVTKKKRPKVLYQGALVQMKTRKLGTLKPRKSRKFRFVVDFPAAAPAGVDQNLAMGSTVTVKFVWTATPRK
jgi:hypothetical protein